MKVGVLIDEPRVGGVEITAINEVIDLRRLGTKTHLLTLRCPHNESFIKRNNVEVPISSLQTINLSFKFPGFSFFSLYHVITPLIASRVLRSEYDIIIAHGTYTCFTAYSLRKFRNMPYAAFIWDPISYILRKVYSGTSLRQMFPLLCLLGEKMDKVIAGSSEVVILPSRYHLDLMKKLTDKPIKIVYPGVEVAKEIPEKRGDYLLAVARWEHGKKPFFYLDLLERLKEEDLLCDLVMVGPWKELSLKKRFLKEVKKRGLINYVRLYGAADRDELKMLYQGARVLVHAVPESFGMIGLEAAACGCPFIIPQNSGVTDLFANGVHGFFPGEGNVEEYAKYTGKLLSDEPFAWKMGYEAWKVAKQYTWQRHATKLNEILNYVKSA
jgi:glycosyltransferase involved in cell wall biosynthesis